MNFPRMTSVVKKLIAGLFVCYVVSLILDGWLQIGVTELLALRPGGPALWQLVTYVLVEPEHPIWFLIGLVFIWWALAPFEIGYGPKRTWQLCAVSVLAASLPAYLVGLVVPSPPLFGSFSLWFGGISATTWINRDRQMALFGMLTMSGKQLLWLFVGLSVLMFLFSKNHTQLIASLGAMGGGIAFVNWMRRPRGASRIRKRRTMPKGFSVIEGGGKGDDDRPKWLN